MTLTLNAPSQTPLAFHVVADDGQLVHARIDGRLSHRFQPSSIPAREEECRVSEDDAKNEEASLDQPTIAGDEPLAVAIGSDAYQRRVLLNLSTVTGMDTSGVNWLLTLQKRMDAVGGRLVLHSLSPAARNVVRVLKLNCALQVAVDELDAVQRM